MTTHWLVDKSAYVRLGDSPDFELWIDRINRGLVSTTGLTLLEFGWSARNGEDWRRVVAAPPAANLLVEYLTPAVEDRAIEVQGELADRGNHRAPSIPDLLVAATAELGGFTVLHVDKDFELVADITGQPLERLRGAW
ncbi:PIN domain nuclease [Nocardioides albidus]|uniref:Ribonuclease VapC n=1 Tax=Nocardioides albidus TaxID=1517589 RepID=A0A5C4VR91_9ACTN|nr:PIN domain nuclease [Nocardioides albidus]TNM38368.1 PIN domain nuclease [Nocardioides albidus]